MPSSARAAANQGPVAAAGPGGVHMPRAEGARRRASQPGQAARPRPLGKQALRRLDDATGRRHLAQVKRAAQFASAATMVACRPEPPAPLPASEPPSRCKGSLPRCGGTIRRTRHGAARHVRLLAPCSWRALPSKSRRGPQEARMAAGLSVIPCFRRWAVWRDGGEKTARASRRTVSGREFVTNAVAACRHARAVVIMLLMRPDEPAAMLHLPGADALRHVTAVLVWRRSRSRRRSGRAAEQARRPGGGGVQGRQGVMLSHEAPGAPGP